MTTAIVRKKEAVVFSIVVAVSLLVMGAVAWNIWARSDMSVLNGTDAPLKIRVDGSEVEVPAGQRRQLQLRVGLQQVEVRLRDELISTEWVNIPALEDAIVYNPLGAATFCFGTLYYAPRGTNPPRGSQQCFPGVTFWTQDDVDYLFTEPPSSLSVKGGGSIRKSVLSVEGDWRLAMRVLRHERKLSAMQSILNGLARTGMPQDEVQQQLATLTFFQQGRSAVAGLAQEWRSTADGPAAAWLYSETLRAIGRTSDMNGVFREAAQKSPDDLDVVKLFARDEPPEVAKTHFERLLATHPDDPDLQVSLGVASLRMGQPEEAMKHFDRATQLGNTDEVDWQARALASVGRPREAAELLAASLQKQFTGELLVPYASLRTALQLDSLPEVGSLLPKSKEEQAGLDRWLSSLVPGAIKASSSKSEDEAFETGLRVHEAARTSALIAWSTCQVREIERVIIDPAVSLLLALEFERMGDHALAAKLGSRIFELSAPLTSLHAYVRTGRRVPELMFLKPEQWAILHFVRARTLEAAGKEARSEYEAAEKADVFQTLTMGALRNWVPPASMTQVSSIQP